MDEDSLSQDQVEDYHEAFCMFDKDGSGTITTKELGDVMRALGQDPTEEELKDIISDVDKENKGMINFEEFLELMTKKTNDKDTLEEEMRAAFKVFDKDKSGKISPAELWIVMESLGERLSKDEIEQMIVAADTDGDGEVNYEEFIKMMAPA